MNHAALYALLGAVGVVVVAIVLAIWKRASASVDAPAEHEPLRHGAQPTPFQPLAQAEPQRPPAPLTTTESFLGSEPLAETAPPLDGVEAAEATLNVGAADTVDLEEAAAPGVALDEAPQVFAARPLMANAPDAITAVLPPPPLAEIVSGMLEVVEIHQSVRGDELGEWVLLRNVSNAPLQLQGCRLSDEGDKHQYTFPACVLEATGELRVHMWSGDDSPSDLYVGRKLPWWNNTGDTAYLYAAGGALIASLHYAATPADA